MSQRKTRKTPRTPLPAAVEGGPDWYKDAIIYEVRVGAFQDSDDDGIGDFRGLTRRLDYVQDLGVTALWLLPFYPSPRRDDGYDIADYNDVHPDSGTLSDFKQFLREAHKRNIRVITELVINHTSDQHPWFQSARRAPPGSKEREFYVWSDTGREYLDARVIFKDFEPGNWSWDPVAGSHYWHRFYHHQPDLNFESPHVRKAVLKALDFWLSMGVDGLRLDAIPYLFEREGTNCENLPETHAYLKELRAHVDRGYADRMLLAEANQWPEDSVAYFGDGDECHMAFHFPVMPRLFMALHMEDRYPILDILDQTPEIPESCQWALFLRNHDELTLEMVTDEERDYMYRVYAEDAEARINLGIRRRLAPLLGNDRRRIELMNALLFSLPGTPVLYYGDEIGMGDNFYLGDRDGVRTPMQWSPDRNGGFSRANPQKLYLPPIFDPEYHYESVNVEAQQQSPHSLLHWTKRLIALCKRHRAFGRGSIEFLHASSRRVLAFTRTLGDERILVVANLSRFSEYAELDLRAYEGLVPVELFSGRPFPPIGELPYLLTLGPHAFFWFRLEEPRPHESVPWDRAPEHLPRLRVAGDWKDAFRGDDREALEALLPEVLAPRRWFGGKARPIDAARVVDAVPGPAGSLVALVEVTQRESGSTVYVLPVCFAEGAAAEIVRHEHPGAPLLELEVETRDGRIVEGVLWDAVENAAFCEGLVASIRGRKSTRGGEGEIVASRTRAFADAHGGPEASREPAVLRGEQTNTSIRFGDRLILKLFRRLAEGTSPDLEVGLFLTEKARFEHAPRVAGALTYLSASKEPSTLAILHELVPNEGDAWRYTLDVVERALGEVLPHQALRPTDPPAVPPLLDAVDLEPPDVVREVVGAYLEPARLLGLRTAELHLALASDPDDRNFSREPLGSLYQRSLYQSMRTSALRTFELARERRAGLPEKVALELDALLELEKPLLAKLRSIVGAKIDGVRIRCHGDYHLGQVLHTGNDFAIIDFEGEPARPLSERRLRRSPLLDVAGMLRSFDYAVNSVLLSSGERGAIRPQDVPVLEPWGRLWRQWVGAAFLRSYLPLVQEAGLVTTDRSALEALLDALLIDKAVYELGYELNNRPDWIRIPARGIRELVEPSAPPLGKAES